MQLKRLLAGVAIACISSGAVADGRTAAHNLFTNMSKANMSMTGINEGNAYVTSTLVRGMYALTSPKGEFAGYVNEAGTVHGDGQGFNIVSTDGSPRRPMTPEETAAFRQEVAAAIDRDKLLRVDYGKGGGNLVEFSAVDCGFCKKFEDALRKTHPDITIYVLPSSLQEIDKGGIASWQKASNFWCTKDGGQAWKAYWETGASPAGGACPFADPHVADVAHDHLQSILRGVGIAVHGTPAYISGEGGLASGVGGKMSKPPAVAAPSHWLAGSDGGGDVLLASADNPYKPQRVNASWTAPVSGSPNTNGQTRQTPGKINLGTALKGLLGK